MIKVTMNLTEKDVENTDTLVGILKARSKAHAISIALSLTNYLVRALLQPGTELLLRHQNGEVEKIVVPEIENHRPSPSKVRHEPARVAVA